MQQNLRGRLLDYMLQISIGFDAVIPRIGAFVELLHAVYTKNCLKPAEYLRVAGIRRVGNLLDLVRVGISETKRSSILTHRS